MTIAPPHVQQSTTLVSTQPSAGFIATAEVNALTQRALAYLDADFPVHFRGPAGTGKTTLALHVANQLHRPVVLMSGDDEFNSSDMIGGQNGYRYRKVVDRFIQSVFKYEEDAVQRWVDNRLTIACRRGFTLVYDEFTRSRAEANNVFLSILEERVLIIPQANQRSGYVRVHPDFRVIFTSNPQEYAGVHHTQDALSDRLITLDLDFYDEATEIAITAARSGLSLDEVSLIVGLVRAFRASDRYIQSPTLRACIMIARVVARQGLPVSSRNTYFVDICLDVLVSKTIANGQNHSERAAHRHWLTSLIAEHCP
jgi:gas vesicle protein GvpN